jgi:antitoxin component YwqK of YwqJK toxin-antitoxin module/peroxiredoxin
MDVVRHSIQRGHGGRRGRLALLAVVLGFGGCQLAENLAANLVERWFSTSEREGKLVDGKHQGEWIFRYPSGAMKAKGKYVDDKQIGGWTYWYENGNVEWQGEFDEQRMTGAAYFGNENGSRRAVGLFVDGLEEDLWTFWTNTGAMECEGDFARGKPTLRWTYFHADGSPLAEGYRYGGERVGPWQFYAADGELSERRFPLPEGVQIVRETWDGMIPRREGMVAGGVPTGRWATYHPDGRRRLTADFIGGEPSGVWVAWAASGEPVARGHVSRGRPEGQWTLWSGGIAERVAGSELDLGAEFSGEWSTGEGGSPRARLATWVAEMRSPVTAMLDMTPDPNVPAPSAEAVAKTESTPSVTLRPQPWTVREQDAMEFLVARYRDGARDAKRPSMGPYSQRRGGEEQGGDPSLSPRFLGTQLPWTRFYRADGGVVDMDDFRGNKKVVLVVLRGFAREVCVYCITQTEALCDNVEAFRAEGCEVFVVYPGERNRLETFLESFQTVSKHMGEPPIGVLYDRDMELVQRMGITSEFAIPSTFVIDERGVIRYSYVGRDIEDRPSTEQVLTAIKALSAP